MRKPKRNKTTQGTKPSNIAKVFLNHRKSHQKENSRLCHLKKSSLWLCLSSCLSCSYMNAVIRNCKNCLMKSDLILTSFECRSLLYDLPALGKFLVSIRNLFFMFWSHWYLPPLENLVEKLLVYVFDFIFIEIWLLQQFTGLLNAQLLKQSNHVRIWVTLCQIGHLLQRIFKLNGILKYF